MSTSPSWFDQEKFSRLVKKVGPKAGSEVTGSLPTPPADPEAQAASPEQALASTARISLVSRPPSLLNENRALPALPRRTAPLPGLKSIFKYPGSESAPAVSKPEAKTGPLPSTPEEPKPEVKSSRLPVVTTEPKPEVKSGPLPTPADEEKIEVKTAPLPAAYVPIPPAEKENEFIPIEPVQNFKAEPKFEFKPEPKFNFKPEPTPEPEFVPGGSSLGMGSEYDLDAIWQKMALLNEELAQTSRERDQAFHDNSILREQLETAETELEKKAGTPAKTGELTVLTQERDQARKQYVDLRTQFETLKRDQNPTSREDSLKFRKELEQQLDGFRQKLEERNKEIAALKAGTGAGTSATGLVGMGATGEVAMLRDQLSKAKEEASVAQRGLALSQKALHETRMTLREATEGTSLSRHNFDNLKAECAALTQQNTVLQAQNDQLSRELAAAKSKLTTRL